MTIGELKEAIKALPEDSQVHAYEGEGGCWIIVKSWDDSTTITEFHTEPV